MSVGRGRSRREGEGVLLVESEGERYRLHNVDFKRRRLGDLQKIVAERTGEGVQTHHFTFGGLRLRNLTQTLQQLGVGHGSVLKLRITKCIVVIAPNEEVELRFHGIDPKVCQCGQLRNAIMKRLANNKPVSLHVQGRLIPPTTYPHPLTSQGIALGTIVHVMYESPKLTPAPSMHSATPTQCSTLPSTTPKPANWPRQAVRIYLLTEGIAGRRGAATGSAPGEVSKLPLPPIRGNTLLTDVRYLVYDMLGVPPRAQMLFNNGVPLPQYGTQEEVRTTVDMVARDEDALTLAIDGDKRSTGYVKELCRSTNVPWCVHCIVHDAQGSATWQPQFVQPTWEVADLSSMITSNKRRNEYCSIYFRGTELRKDFTIEGCGINEGSVVLALIHETMDLSIDVVLLDGRTLQTMIRGVPPESAVLEVVNRSLHTTEVRAPISSFSAAYNGTRLPPTASLSSCGLPQRSTITITQDQSFLPSPSPQPHRHARDPSPQQTPLPHFSHAREPSRTGDSFTGGGYVTTGCFATPMSHPAISPSRDQPSTPKMVRWPPILNP